MSAAPESMLFPKITQHIAEVVKVLKEQDLEQDTSDSIPIIGYAKLHGTHGDIVIYPNDKIILQSKNVSNITPLNDNLGFAAAMADKTPAILAIRNQYVERWKGLNPSTPLDAHSPVVIAGEWIGTGIQKHVAVAQLSRRFVIVCVAINNAWVPDVCYAGIEAEAAGIYNVSRAGTYRTELHAKDLALTLRRVDALTERVASVCPFALEFGIAGEGEGIVWKPEADHLNGNPALWFKTKGGRFKPAFAAENEALPAGVREQREAADRLAAVWCTEERLQQGWDYLGEVGVKREMKALRTYLVCVQNDVCKEEKAGIEERGVDVGVLRAGIARIARAWYIRRVGMGDE